MNYDLEMDKQISNLEEGSKLLLHACCAPCSSAVLERLGNFFRISIFYYNFFVSVSGFVPLYLVIVYLCLVKYKP